MKTLRSTLEVLKTVVDAAKVPEDLFGHKATMKSEYRRLTLALHTDRVEAQDEKFAEPIFKRVSELWAQAEAKLASGTYGDRRPVKPDLPPYREVKLSTGSLRLTLVGLLGEGGVSSVHEARVEGDKTGSCFFLKLARRPSDNDLLEREFRNLSRIVATDKNPGKEEFYKKMRPYVPHPYRSFSVAGPGGVKRKANLLIVPQAERFTIQELREDHPKFSDGMERKHVYWILRRLVLTLFMAHTRGIVHGAVTPDHVLIYPKEHGLVLTGWTASTEEGKGHVPIMDPQWSAIVPPSVRAKRPASFAQDMAMAAGTALYLLGDNGLPSNVKAILDECVQEKHYDANALYDLLGAAMEKADGKREYAELIV